ncbi:MAG: zinc ribbon domain-containing protein, partial [Lachnospiraceae bacterium]|nr:zinc ribbon domain-containing protein [Lachnospiraceae bacterium]
MGVKLERIVKPYYDWLHEGKIMARKCTKCGAVEWPPLLGCNTCGSPDMEWIEMSGKGKMVQMVMPAPITRKPEMNDIKPYCFGVIEL